MKERKMEQRDRPENNKRHWVTCEKKYKKQTKRKERRFLVFHCTNDVRVRVSVCDPVVWCEKRHADRKLQEVIWTSESFLHLLFQTIATATHQGDDGMWRGRCVWGGGLTGKLKRYVQEEWNRRAPVELCFSVCYQWLTFSEIHFNYYIFKLLNDEQKRTSYLRFNPQVSNNASWRVMQM